MINVILREELVDHDYMEQYTLGFDGLKQRASAYSLEKVTAITGVPANDSCTLAREYATTQLAVIRIGVAIARHAGGGQTVRSVAYLKVMHDSEELFKFRKICTDKEENKNLVLHTTQQYSSRLRHCAIVSGYPPGQNGSDMPPATPYERMCSDVHRDSRWRKDLKKWILILLVASLSITVAPANTSTLTSGSPAKIEQNHNSSPAALPNATHLFQHPSVSTSIVDTDEKGSPASFLDLSTMPVDRKVKSRETTRNTALFVKVTEDIPMSTASMPAWVARNPAGHTSVTAFRTLPNVGPSLNFTSNQAASSTTLATPHGVLEPPTHSASGASELLPAPSPSGGADATVTANTAMTTPEPSASRPDVFIFTEKAKEEKAIATPEPSASLLLAVGLLGLVGYARWYKN